MKHTAATIAAITLSPIAHADLTLFAPLPGYSAQHAATIAADGSAVAWDMFNADGYSNDAFLWTADGWHALPRFDNQNYVLGLSGNGRTTLTGSMNFSGGNSLTLERDGQRTNVAYGQGGLLMGALTRDGRTVFGGDQTELYGHTTLWRWSNGERTDLGQLGPGTFAAVTFRAGDRDDLFAFDTIRTEGARTTIYESGTIREIGIVSNLNDGQYVDQRSSGMTADGSVIIGNEIVDSLSHIERHAWMYTNGSITEITVAGAEFLTVGGITDDASLITASASFDGQDLTSFLIRDGGGIVLVDTLLANAGLTLADYESVSIHAISGDGTLIAGSILDRRDGSIVSLYTLSIPAPSGVLPLAGLLTLARRRR